MSYIAAAHMAPGLDRRMVVGSLQLLPCYNSAIRDGPALLHILKPVQGLLEGVRVEGAVLTAFANSMCAVTQAADNVAPSLSHCLCITDNEQGKALARALEEVLQLLGATDSELVLKVRLMPVLHSSAQVNPAVVPQLVQHSSNSVLRPA